MNLIIDAGNHSVKLAVYDGGQLIYHQSTDGQQLARKVKEICDQYPRINRSIVCSVGDLNRNVLAVLAVFCEVHELSTSSKTPFKNSYATPQTLGLDRIALATSAFYENSSGNTLVIDAGTCITYDMVNDFGEYLGGAISPGLHMRYKSMHEQTAKLPLLEPAEFIDFIGNSTQTGMHSGVIGGITAEIDTIITQYQTRFTDLTVILTGGDAQFLSKRLKNTIFADSEFLLKGLNYLLEYNR